MSRAAISEENIAEAIRIYLRETGREPYEPTVMDKARYVQECLRQNYFSELILGIPGFMHARMVARTPDHQTYALHVDTNDDCMTSSFPTPEKYQEFRDGNKQHKDRIEKAWQAAGFPLDNYRW